MHRSVSHNININFHDRRFDAEKNHPKPCTPFITFSFFLFFPFATILISQRQKRDRTRKKRSAVPTHWKIGTKDFPVASNERKSDRNGGCDHISEEHQLHFRPNTESPLSGGSFQSAVQLRCIVQTGTRLLTDSPTAFSASNSFRPRSLLQKLCATFPSIACDSRIIGSSVGKG